MWFRPRARAAAFEPGALPVWLWERAWQDFHYGFPNLGHGFKLGNHHPAAEVAPTGLRPQHHRAGRGGDPRLARRHVPRCERRIAARRGMPVHPDARRALPARPAPQAAEHRDRQPLLRARLQVRAGHRGGARRPVVGGPDAPRSAPVHDRPPGSTERAGRRLIAPHAERVRGAGVAASGPNRLGDSRDKSTQTTRTTGPAPGRSGFVSWIRPVGRARSCDAVRTVAGVPLRSSRTFGCCHTSRRSPATLARWGVRPASDVCSPFAACGCLPLPTVLPKLRNSLPEMAQSEGSPGNPIRDRIHPATATRR